MDFLQNLSSIFLAIAIQKEMWDVSPFAEEN